MTTFPARRASTRRERTPVRFRADIEALERRLPLAAGVTGTPLTVGLQVAGQPLVTFNPAAIDLPQTPGRPVPLVILASDAGPLRTQGFAATVDWGDGTPADPAAIVDNNGKLTVEGPDHTYATPGTFAITVAVSEPGDPAATPFRTQVTVNPPNFPLSAQLAASSDSGASTAEGIATTATPTFTGTTQPGARVTLAVVPASDPGATPTAIGTTTADAAGNWSLTSRVLGVGTYLVTAQAIGAFGVTNSAPVRTLQTTNTDPSTVFDRYNDLVITEAAAAASRNGPKVTRFQVTGPRLGLFRISLADGNPGGLDLAPLLDPGSYVATLATGPQAGRSLGVANLLTNVTLSPVPGQSLTYPSVTVFGQLGDGSTRLPRNAAITLTVRAAAIADTAGVALDGEFRGKYPTGDATPGGDFRVRITTRNGRIVGATPIRAPKVVARPVHALKHHA